MIEEFCHLVRRKNTHKIVIYVLISYFFESFFNLEITDSFGHFLHATKKIIILLFFVFLALCNLQHQNRVHFSRFYF